MKNKSLLVTAIIGIATLFLAAALYAGSAPPDIIKLQDNYEHTKGIVEFSHKKHVTEYKNGCGDCHHDENGKPRTDLKEGDAVKKCFECHNKPGEKPKGKDAPKLSKKEELQYHAEAMHENCRECHKEYNKKNKTKAAPTTCTKCHPKTM